METKQLYDIYGGSVYPQVAPYETITVSGPTELVVGDTGQITVTTTPTVTYPHCVYIADNTIVSCAPDGTVTAIAAGTGIIYVIDTLNTASFQKVEIPVKTDVVGSVSGTDVQLYDTVGTGTYTLKYEDSTDTPLEDFDNITNLTI